MTQKSSTFREADAGDGTTVADQQVKGVQLFLTLLSCVLTLFLAALDQTIISTLLTEVGNKFGSFQNIGWLTSGFLLPMATLSPSYGKLSIIFGRKYTLFFGVVIFEIGSLICGLSQNMNMLIAGRVIQGIGGGAIQTMVSVIITESVPIQKRPLALSLIGCTFAVASVLGPIIGGAFTTHVTWRWCFYVNLPIGGVALMFLVFGFNPPRVRGDTRNKLRQIDYLGTVLLVSGLVLILLAMTFGGNDFPWKSAAVIVCFTLGGLLVVGFCIWNFAFSNHPIIPLEVVRVPQIVACAISAAFGFAFFMGLLIYLAIYFQVIFGASAWRSGIDLLPMIISVVVCSALSGVLLKVTRNVKIFLMASCIAGPIGVGLVTILSENSSVSDRIGLLIVSGISVGLQFQTSTISAQLSAPATPGSLILTTTFINFSRAFGGTLGSSLSQVMFSARARIYLSQVLQSFPPETQNMLSQYDAAALLSSPDLVKMLPSQVQPLIIDAFMKSVKDVFYLCLAFSFVSLLGGIFSTNKMIPKAEKHVDSDLESPSTNETKVDAS